MKKKFKKKLIAVALTGVLFSTTVISGTTLQFLLHSNENNKVYFTFNDSQYDVTLQVDNFIKKFENERNPYFKTTNYELVGDDPYDPDPEPDPEEPDVNSSTKEKEAEWLEVAFMTAALTGHYDYEDDLSQAELGTILNPRTDEDEWLSADLTNFEEIYNYMVLVKLFSETTGNTNGTVSLDKYVTSLYVTDPVAAEAGYFIVEQNIRTIYDLQAYRNKGNVEKEQVDKFLLELSNSLTYRLDITTFIYVYAYLWQESYQDKFDYMLTQELYNQLPTLVFTQEINSTIHPGLNLKSMGGKATNDPSVNWNDLNTQYDYISVKENNKLWNDDTSPIGYSGLWTRSSKSSLAFGDELWTSSNSFEYLNVPDEQDKIISYTENSFTSSRKNPRTAYVYADSLGEVIQTLETSETDEETGTETTTSTDVIYAYTTISPFVFATDRDGEDIPINYEATMYAVIEEETDDKYTLRPATKDEKDAINVFEFLTDTESDNPDDKNEYIFSQLYIMYTIYTQNLDLSNSTYDYWNDRGFYIELSGKYEKDYGSYIPILLQR